jgi:hypothetical protein
MAEQMRRSTADVPTRIGPAEFGTLGALITVRCPRDFDHLMRQAGGQWDPGSRRWLSSIDESAHFSAHSVGKRNPLNRRAGMSLDEI